MGVRQTSIDAYKAILPSLSNRQKEVFEVLAKHPEGLTDQELADKLGWPINEVTPRRGELFLFKWVVKQGKKVSERTKRACYIWKAVVGSQMQWC